MNIQKPSKINQLLRAWPNGTVAVYPWLKKQGISRQLADTYCKGQWIERIGVGAFKLSGDTVDWTGGVYALQYDLNYDIHVAAHSALELQGYGHYIPLGDSKSIWLYKPTSEKRNLPLWFVEYFSKDNAINYVKRNLFTNNNLEIVDISVKNYSLKVSSPERAIIEVVDLVPNYLTCEYALHLIEGMTTLRPKALEKLLTCCKSVKTKRLFLLLAERQNHPWLKRISFQKIDLGLGKRMIGAGGYYSRKYQISIPINLEMKEGNVPDA